jgi:hypothetical protein
MTKCLICEIELIVTSCRALHVWDRRSSAWLKRCFLHGGNLKEIELGKMGAEEGINLIREINGEL